MTFLTESPRHPDGNPGRFPPNGAHPENPLECFIAETGDPAPLRRERVDALLEFVAEPVSERAEGPAVAASAEAPLHGLVAFEAEPATSPAHDLLQARRSRKALVIAVSALAGGLALGIPQVLTTWSPERAYAPPPRPAAPGPSSPAVSVPAPEVAPPEVPFGPQLPASQSPALEAILPASAASASGLDDVPEGPGTAVPDDPRPAPIESTAAAGFPVTASPGTLPRAPAPLPAASLPVEPLPVEPLPVDPPTVPPTVAATESVAPGRVAGGPPAPASAVVAPDAEIQRILQRYASAYSALDVPSVQAVWPGVDSRALERAFDDLVEQEVDLGACAIAVDGAQATASCSGLTRYVPKVGGRSVRTQRRVWTFALARDGGGWAIQSIRAR